MRVRLSVSCVCRADIFYYDPTCEHHFSVPGMFCLTQSALYVLFICF